jgi:hypothetical protein
MCARLAVRGSRTSSRRRRSTTACRPSATCTACSTAPKVPTPSDDVAPLPVAPSAKVLAPAKIFRLAAANLTDAKTRARFMVIASTGVPPAELKRADVDLERKAWIVRTAKGGEPRAFWVNADVVGAWEAFIAVDAWGHFEAATTPRPCTRPAGRRTCGVSGAAQHGARTRGARHRPRGLSAVLGDRQIATTRKHYAPVLVSRLKDASERLAGRFKGLAAGSGRVGRRRRTRFKQPRLRHRCNRHGRDGALKANWGVPRLGTRRGSNFCLRRTITGRMPGEVP